MNQSPFEIRGVIEGFYGVFYTFPERNDLIRFIGEHGYNLYIYSSKNDRQHRTRWWEPYPKKVMEEFAETVRVAKEAGVDFCYAISPGVSMSYSSVEDFQQVIAKLYDFYKIGVRTFSVLLDDITPTFRSEADRKRYRSYGETHYEFCNRVYTQLQIFDPAIKMSMCPTDYYGKAPFSEYIHELGQGLHPAIDVFYTGTEVCPRTIATADLEAFGQAIGRKPLVWDNYPVNDLKMEPEMHIGPIEGRDASLYQASRGIVVNPMNQAEASKIALLTFADYFDDPHHYDPMIAWQKALRAVAGEEFYTAILTFGENSLHSCLREKDAQILEDLTKACVNSLKKGTSLSQSRDMQALEDYLVCLDETCYTLRYRMENIALRNNLLPWIEALEFWQRAGQFALQTLAAMESGEDFAQPYRDMQENLTQAQQHYKRMTGRALLPLIELVHERMNAIEATAG